MAFTLQVITPDRVVFDGPADFVSVRGVEGELGIMPGHIPLFTKVVPELMTVHHGGKKELVAVMGGFLDVHPDKVTLLSDAAEMASEIDAVRARHAKERAEAQASKVKDVLVEAALQRALIRLKAIELLGGLKR